jgi:hypothetical protein
MCLGVVKIKYLIKDKNTIPSIYELPLLICDPYLSQYGYAESSVNWWKWLLSIPKSFSPAFDYRGSFAYLKQNDPSLFFLCQTIETTDSIPQREVIIPYGKKIFMPLINWLSVRDDEQSDEELIALANERMDNIGRIELHINGKQLIDNFPKYRVRSPFFEVILCSENILDVKPGKTRLLSDGYWIMLESAMSKEVTLTTLGACSLGKTQIGVGYHIAII